MTTILEAGWRVTVSIGPPPDPDTGAQDGPNGYWETFDNSPPDAVNVLDGLTVSASLPEDKPWPSQPNPASLSLSLILPDPADGAPIVFGAWVAVNVYLDRAGVSWGFGTDASLTFDGRVTDVKWKPHSLGVLVSLTAVDHLASLAAAVVDMEGGRPQELTTDRLNAYWNAAEGADPPLPAWEYAAEPWWNDGGGHVPGLLAAKESESTTADLLSLVTGLLDSLPGENPGGRDRGRVVLRPNLWGMGEGAPRALDSWVLAAAFQDADLDQLGGVFGDTGAGYGVVIPTATGATLDSRVLDAGLIELESEWAATPAGSVFTRTIIRGKWNGAPERADNGGTPRRNYRHDADLVTRTDGEVLAAAYLPDAPTGPLWQVEGLNWVLHRDLAGRRLPALGDVVTITGMSPARVPVNREYHAGQVQEYTFGIGDGKPRMEIQLIPFLRPVETNHTVSQSLTWSRVTAGVTWADLNPTDTWHDYRLIGPIP